jgi:hypothetical protein
MSLPETVLLSAQGLLGIAEFGGPAVRNSPAQSHRSRWLNSFGENRSRRKARILSVTKRPVTGGRLSAFYRVYIPLYAAVIEIARSSRPFNPASVLPS